MRNDGKRFCFDALPQAMARVKGEADEQITQEVIDIDRFIDRVGFMKKRAEVMKEIVEANHDEF